MIHINGRKKTVWGAELVLAQAKKRFAARGWGLLLQFLFCADGVMQGSRGNKLPANVNYGAVLVFHKKSKVHQKAGRKGTKYLVAKARMPGGKATSVGCGESRWGEKAMSICVEATQCWHPCPHSEPT